MICCLCQHECDGTMMRTDPRYSRTRTMLEDEAVPRDRRGLMRLCHVCQREICFRGGYIKYLARIVDRMARYKKHRQSPDAKKPTAMIAP